MENGAVIFGPFTQLDKIFGGFGYLFGVEQGADFALVSGKNCDGVSCLRGGLHDRGGYGYGFCGGWLFGLFGAAASANGQGQGEKYDKYFFHISGLFLWHFSILVLICDGLFNHMKNFAKKIVLFLLKRMAKARLRRFKGKIIAVTGSVGKTSTKEAIYSVLNSRFRVKKSKKSMNSDFGLLLTILDIESGFSSATKWTWYLMKGFFHSLRREYCEVLLLEMGVDKPGDMDFLTSIVKPDIVVMTNIFHTHLAEGQFTSLEDIFAEKSKLVKALKKDGKAILNLDNPFTANLARGREKAATVTFGEEERADYRASRVKQSIDGMSFILEHKGKKYEVPTAVIGKYQIYTILPAIICAELLGMSAQDAIEAVGRYSLPPGRMGIIPAINEAIILDSSYNSSPAALKEALHVLAEVSAERRVAVLGNMNELGSESERLHKLIGELVPRCADLLLTVGENAALIGESAIKHGMNAKSVFSFKSAEEATEFFKDKIKKGDTILVKGSQNNVRLERFVKALMRNPEDAKDLLVRQSREWEAKL